MAAAVSWFQLAIYTVVFTVGAAFGVKFHAGITAQRDLATHEAQAKATAKKLDRGDKAAVGHEADKSQIRTEFVTITQEVERVVEKPVYRNMCFDDDGLRLLGNAIAGRPAASQPAPALPEPSATR